MRLPLTHHGGKWAKSPKKRLSHSESSSLGNFKKGVLGVGICPFVTNVASESEEVKGPSSFPKSHYMCLLVEAHVFMLIYL